MIQEEKIDDNEDASSTEFGFIINNEILQTPLDVFLNERPEFTSVS